MFPVRLYEIKNFRYTYHIMEQKLTDLSLEKKSPVIIALDLDDTLLKSDLSISDYTVSTLQFAAEHGIYIVLCSGRTDNAILPYVRRLDIAGKQTGRYIIAQNGTSISDLHKRCEIYSRLTDSDTLIKVYHEARKMNLSAEVYDASTIYVPYENSWTDRDKSLTNLKMQVVTNYEDFLQKKFPKIVIPGDPADIQKLLQRMKTIMGDSCVIVTSKPFYLEVQSRDSGKGEALLWLAEYLGLDNNRVMAFGDSMNDESMIQKAPLSVAMKNGIPLIKEQARFITEYTNEEDGVARFLNKFVFNKPE